MSMKETNEHVFKCVLANLIEGLDWPRVLPAPQPLNFEEGSNDFDCCRHYALVIMKGSRCGAVFNIVASLVNWDAVRALGILGYRHVRENMYLMPRRYEIRCNTNNSSRLGWYWNNDYAFGTDLDSPTDVQNEAWEHKKNKDIHSKGRM